MNEIFSEQFLRAGVLQQIDVALSRLGCDPVETLADIGFSVSTFNSGECLLHLRDMLTVLEHCAKAANSPDFSLHLGSVQDISFLGDLGLLMQTAPSLGHALREFPVYMHIHAQPVSWIAHEEGDFASFTFSMDTSQLSTFQRRLATELAMAQFNNILKTISVTSTNLSFITMHRTTPANKKPYQQCFNTPIEFNSENDSLYILKENMNKPVVHSNEQLYTMVKDRIRQSGYYQNGSTLTQQIRGIIRSLLSQGSCSIEAVSKVLGCDKRTLQRHLRDDYQTSFQIILDEVRFDQARLYLKETNMPLTQLAYVLGFSDSSNLSRAFSKYYGISPKQWRSENQNIAVRRNRLAIR